jgi:RND family efflux transporter MFP subunit
MKRIFLYLFTAQLLAACSDKQANDLGSKKEKLAELKKQKQDIEKQMLTLETEISKLDTSAEQLVKIKTVNATEIKAEPFQHFISVQGYLEAEDNLMVSSKMPGMITSIKVKQGDLVAEGQILAVLDDEILRKSIDEVKVSLDQTNILFEKQKTLWEQKIGTELQYLTLKNQKEGLEKKLVTLKSQQNQNLVTAPFAGMIDEVYAKTGSMASPGAPLVQLVNTSNVKATAKVPDSYVAFVKNGDKVHLQFPDLNKSFQGQVSFVGRVVDPLSRTFKIEVKMPAGMAELKPNLLTLVQINDKTLPSAIVIEENIIQPTENGKIVFVASEENGKKVAKQKSVVTGLSFGGKVEVVSGLAAGEKLITTGYQDLFDNQPISF